MDRNLDVTQPIPLFFVIKLIKGEMTVMNKDEAAKLNEIFRRKSSAAINSLIQTPPRSSLVARTGGQSVKPPFSPVPTRKSTSVLNRPTWVDSISDEFNVKLSETQNAKPVRKQIFDVSPAPKKRSLPRVRFSDNDNVRVLSAEPEIVTDGSRDLENDENENKNEIRKRKQREKRRRRGVLLSEPET